MDSVKTGTQLLLVGLEVRRVENRVRPGRRPRHDEMALSEAARKKIQELIARRDRLPSGPKFRKLKLCIGTQIHALRHPDKKRSPEALQAAREKWLKNNQDKRKQVANNWYHRNKKPLSNPNLAFTRVANYGRKYRRANVQFMLKDRLRVVMSRAMRRQFARKSDRTFELIGCTPLELRDHIENQFLPGMSWENRHLWHVDHRKPLASFDLTQPEQQRAAFHYSNLQPLWATDNHRKGAKVLS